MKCPGQDSRFWKDDAIFEVKCPHCGAFLEFFRDDSWRVCKNCSHKVPNPRMDFGCAAHCPYAEQCLGELSPELLAKKEELLKEKVARAVKQYLKDDFEGIGQAAKIARHAEDLAQKQGADMAVVVISAYLIPLVERLGKQEPDIIKTVLQKQGAPPVLIKKIHDCINSHKDPNDLNSKILADAIKKAVFISTAH